MCIIQPSSRINIYCHSLFHAPFNNLYSIHNCLLCRNPGNESALVTKMKSLIYEAVNTYIFMHTVYKMYKMYKMYKCELSN